MPSSPVKVTLTRGVSYFCQVRARASVGYGPWSARVKLAGAPKVASSGASSALVLRQLYYLRVFADSGH